MLDHLRYLGEEIGSYKSLVFKTTDENILDRKKTNEEVLHLVGMEHSLIKTISKRQMKFLGHISRKDGLEKPVLRGKIEGKDVEEDKEQHISTT